MLREETKDHILELEKAIDNWPCHLPLLIRSAENSTNVYTTMAQYCEENPQGLTEHPMEYALVNRFLMIDGLLSVTVIRYADNAYLKQEVYRVGNQPKMLHFYMANTQYADARWWLDVIVRNADNKFHIEFDRVPTPIED